jgi:hypothetical protein
MYMQVRAPEENNMAITRHRLQQIIKEEVSTFLREQEEEEAGAPEGAGEEGAAEEPEAAAEPDGAEGAVGALENAAYEAARKSMIAAIEAKTAEEKAAALEELKATVERYGIEVDLDGQIESLRKMATELGSEAQRSAATKDQAEAALEQINAIIGSVSTVSEGVVLERWNRLAFGRKLL